MLLLSAVAVAVWATAVQGWRYRGGARRPHRDVTTTEGVVRGYQLQQPPHYAFVGIPYGAPPTGPDMYKVQGPPQKWDGVFEATHRVKCPQPAEPADHNCLVVNVFAPLDATDAPVMVHFHGGDFHSGWGAFEAPPRLISAGIVVVTFNYRLGAAGFLCLGDETAPGNAGLKDQALALYWLGQNIRQFGGNPGDVTAYGTGAGAASVELLLLSGAADGFIHKAILESGSALSPISMLYKPLAVAAEVANAIADTEILDLSEFYTNLSYADTLQYSHRFKPCVERASGYMDGLIERDPLDILKSTDFYHVPMMFVYTSQEGQAIIHEDTIKWHSIGKETFENLMPSNLDFYDEGVGEKIAESAKDFYFNIDEADDSAIIQSFANYLGDTVILYPLVKSAVMHSVSCTFPVYLMEFKYKGRPSRFRDIEAAGASHGDILRFIFSKDRLNTEDELTAERMSSLWSNFIKHGDPTPIATTQIPVVWQPLRAQSVQDASLHSLNLLTLDSALSMKTSDNHHMAFWDRIYNKYYITHLPVDETDY